MKRRALLPTVTLGLTALTAAAFVARDTPLGLRLGTRLASDLRRSSAEAREALPLPGGADPDASEEPEEDAERTLARGRDRWIRALHRAPPGLDWRAIERGNGEAAILRRNARGTAGPEAGTWTERGSVNQAGRIRMAVPASDGAHLYAGADLGGAWRGTTDGLDWQPLGDNLYGGAHRLVAVPTAPGEPDVLVIGTDGGSVHRSADDGATWQVPAGLPALVSLRSLVRSTEPVPHVWLIGADTERTWHLYRSVDAGASFTEVADLGTFPGDVWAPRDGSSAVYLYRDDAVYRSVDGGDTFEPVGAVGSGATSGELSGCEAGAPTLWLITHASDGVSLYRSDDAGATWARTGPVTDFYGSYQASRVDPTLFAYGGVEAHVTHDGGATFASVNPWGNYYRDPANQLHADVFGLQAWATGDGQERWYVGTDGGLFASDDGLVTVHNLSLSGLRVGQYYSTLTSAADPTHVDAGAQDQGLQASAGQAPSGDLLAFAQLVSGDYGHLTSGDGTHAWVFSTYPGYILALYGEEEPHTLSASFPSGESYEWIPPVLADPAHPDNFYFGASHLYYYERTRDTWTPALWSEESFASASSHYISAIAVSPLDPSRMWVATDAGRAYHSEDEGVTWTRSSDHLVGGQYFYGQALLPSVEDVDTVYLGGSGYGSPAVYRSRDGGETWESWGEGLPDTLVYSLAEAHDGSGRVYAGTETSAYERGPGDAGWTDITPLGAPINLYWSAETLPDGVTIRFGTYGRGIWDYHVSPAPLDTGDGSADDTAGDSAPPDAEDPPDTAKPGCGCTTPVQPSGGGAMALGAALGLTLARRRARQSL